MLRDRRSRPHSLIAPEAINLFCASKAIQHSLALHLYQTRGGTPGPAPARAPEFLRPSPARVADDDPAYHLACRGRVTLPAMRLCPYLASNDQISGINPFNSLDTLGHLDSPLAFLFACHKTVQDHCSGRGIDVNG